MERKETPIHHKSNGNLTFNEFSNQDIQQKNSVLFNSYNSLQHSSSQPKVCITKIQDDDTPNRAQRAHSTNTIDIHDASALSRIFLAFFIIF